jgi:hypothetical protein
MPFPKKTLDEIFSLRFNREDDSYDSKEKMHENCIDQECYIELIAQILKVYKFCAIKPLLSKQSVTIQKQSEEVLKELSFNSERCDIEFKRLGHILNKLAELQDPKLTDEFLEKVTQKFNEITKTQRESQKISDLLRNFHMFITKTPTESQQQKKTVKGVQQYIRNNVSDPAEFVFYGEVFLYSEDDPFVLGTIDGAVLIPCEENKYRLIILEYDGGIGKTRSDKNDRIKKYAEGALGKISFTAPGIEKYRYFTTTFDVSSVEVVSIQRKDYIPEDRLNELLAEKSSLSRPQTSRIPKVIKHVVDAMSRVIVTKNRFATLTEEEDDRSEENKDNRLSDKEKKSDTSPASSSEDRVAISELQHYEVKEIFKEKSIHSDESDDYASSASSGKPRPIIDTVKGVFNFMKSISNCARRDKQ